MSPILIVLLVASALFAWSMGSHYTGAVMGTAYGSGILSMRKALVFAAAAAFVGSAVASIRVIDTYANGLVPQATTVYIASAQLSAAIVTIASTYFRLPTSTIQIYTFSLLGAALVGGLPVHAAGFGLVILFWVVGPLAAFVIGFILAKLGLDAIKKKVLVWFVVLVSIYSSFTLGSNDVSNAASSLVAVKILSPRFAGLYGGFFMLLGVLTWGQRLLMRIGHDILKLDVPLAATAQLAQAISQTVINAVGYNASINQTIIGGMTGSGLSVGRNRLNWQVIRNIILNWGLSPVLGLACSAIVALIFQAIF